MATSKQQTNESRLKKLIAENPTIPERILKIMEITEEDIKENPSDWEQSLIHPSLWHQLNDNVQKYLNS